MWATMASLSCASAVHLFPFSFSPFLSPKLRSNQQVMLRKERGVQGENYGKRTANAGRRIVYMHLEQSVQGVRRLVLV